MWEKLCAIDKFIKQVHDGATFWTPPAADHFTVTATKLDQVLASDDRFYDQHKMVNEQLVYFIANRGNATELDFYQYIAADNINPIVVQRDFLAGLRIRIELF